MRISALTAFGLILFVILAIGRKQEAQELLSIVIALFVLKSLKKEVGLKPEGEKWIQWKCDQATGFVVEVRSLVNKTSKKTKLGIFSVPWREKDYDGAIKRIIGQDFKKLSKFIDVFTPMTYHVMTGNQPAWIHQIVLCMSKLTGKPVLPIIQTEDKPFKISNQEFGYSIKMATQSPSSGVVVFFLEDFFKKESKVKAFIDEFL